MRRRRLLLRVGQKKKLVSQDNDDDDAQNSCGTVVLRCGQPLARPLVGKTPRLELLSQVGKSIF